MRMKNHERELKRAQVRLEERTNVLVQKTLLRKKSLRLQNSVAAMQERVAKLLPSASHNLN